MRFEYFGLPGTGKSYLCRELTEHYAINGNNTVTVSGIIEDQSYLSFNLHKIRHAALFIISNPKVVWRVIGASKSYKLKSSRRYITKLINLFAELKKTENDVGNVVIEQGVLQAIWSLEMLSHGNIANKLLDELLRWLPARVIVVLPPNNQFYVAQLINRDKGQSHFDALSEAEISQSLGLGSRAIDDILELIKTKKMDLEVLTLVNNHQLKVAETEKWISNMSA